LAVTLVIDAVDWGLTAWRVRAADSEMRALLMKSFPETRLIVDPAEQMRRGLEVLGARGGGASPGELLYLPARASPAFGREAGLRVQALEYADKALTVRVAATQRDADSLASALRSRSLEVTVERTGGEVRLKLRSPGAPKGGQS